MNEPMYIIPQSDLLSLLRQSEKLSALEAGGVDNWEWYCDSIRDHINWFLEYHPEIELDEDDRYDFSTDDIALYYLENEYEEVQVAEVIETIEDGHFHRECSNCGSDVTTLT